MKIERTFYGEYKQLLQMTEHLLREYDAQQIMHTKAAERFRLVREIAAKTDIHQRNTVTLAEFHQLAYHAVRVADELNKDIVIETQNSIGTISLIGPSIVVNEMVDEFIIRVLDEILPASEFSSRTIEKYGEPLSKMTFSFNLLG